MLQASPRPSSISRPPFDADGEVVRPLRTDTAGGTRQHFAQLDGLRCFASVLVVWQHSAAPSFPTVGQSGLGVYGVWLFFVLSGFLITGILLRVRDDRLPLGSALRAFYARRFLRIVPLYLAVVLGGALFGIGESFRHDLPWHLLYASNWLYALRGRWGDVATPLWSLSIEEQFYLVWPLLVLLTPLRYFRRLLLVVIVLGPLSRVVAMLLSDATSVRMLPPTPSEFDSLGLGALLATARHSRATNTGHVQRFATYGVWCGLGILAAVIALTISQRGWRLMCTVEACGAALVSTWIVQTASVGFGKSSMGRVVESVLLTPVVAHLGRISYGLYLLHGPVIWFFERYGISRRLTVTGGASVVYFALVLATTAVVATLSWYLFESPINSLKRHFSY